MIKKIVSFLLSLLMIVSIFSVIPVSVSALSNGDFGYNILSDGTAEITGYNDYYENYDGNLEIPGKIDGYTVTSIADRAFMDYFRSLSSISIPNSVKHIGSYAFLNCFHLTNITIPNSVVSIENSAFENCSKLENIWFPDGNISIGTCAFENTAWYNNHPDGVVYAGKVVYDYKGEMPENTSITLENGTKGIADSAFSGCKNLNSITIPNSVNSI